MSAAHTPDPYAWCIASANSADWCFSATKSGVEENAKLMDEDCWKTAPFPLFTEPQESAVNAELLRAINNLLLAASNSDHQAWRDAQQDARAAIAKATGSAA